MTYLICLIGSLRGEKTLYLVYIIAYLSFIAGALRLDLRVGATSLGACGATSVTTRSL